MKFIPTKDPDTLEYNGSTVVGWSELPKFEEEDQ